MAFHRQQMIDPRHQALATMEISGAPKNYIMLFSTHPPLEQRIAALQQASLRRYL